MSLIRGDRIFAPPGLSRFYLPATAAMSMPQDSPHHHQISRTSYHLDLPPDLLNQLGGDVLVPKRVPRQAPGGQVRVAEEPESLVRHPNGYRIANLGLFDFFRTEAQRRGSDLTFVHSPQHQGISENVPSESVAAFVRDHRCGLLRYGGKDGRAAMVAQIFAAHPRIRGLVVSDETRELRRFEKAYRRVGGDCPPVLSHSRRPTAIQDHEDYPRLALCPPLEAANFEPEKCDVIIVLDALAATQTRYVRLLEATDMRAHLFGCLRAGRQFWDYERAHLHRVFGFSIHDTLDGTRPRRPVQRVEMTYRGPGRSGSPFNGRRNLLQAPHRNRLLAKAANLLAESSSTADPQWSHLRPAWSEGQTTPRVVTILVDRLEHAMLLEKQLPGWEICGPMPDSSARIASGMRDRIQRPNVFAMAYRRIVVAASAKRVSGWDSDVILWACAGEDTRLLPESWLCPPAEQPRRPLTIVDCCDRASRSVREITRSRQAAWHERGIVARGSILANHTSHDFVNS